jgi:hypothetical protein
MSGWASAMLFRITPAAVIHWPMDDIWASK